MIVDQDYARKSGREETPNKDMKAINFMVKARKLLGLFQQTMICCSSSLVSGWLVAHQRARPNEKQVRRLPKQKC